jgi:hypothetical protein
MTDEQKAPWDQLEGEPSPAYARFLVYRNLGPGRSLERAYQAFLSTIYQESAENRRKPPQLSGQWSDDSSRYGWVARAAAWDIEMLATAGEQIVINFIEAVRALSQKAVEALSRPEVKPDDWRDLLEAIRIVGDVLSVEAIATVASRARHHAAAPGAEVGRSRGPARIAAGAPAGDPGRDPAAG